MTSCVNKEAGNSETTKPLTAEEQSKLNKELIRNVRHGSVSAVKKLLDKGADANARDEDGRPVLILGLTTGLELSRMAYYSYTKGIVRTKDGPVRLKETSGNEGRLDKGISKNLKEIIGLLLSKGADVDARDKNNRTALMFATRLGWIQIVELFLSKKANVKVTDIYGDTALMWAVVS
ncbi:MAG: ankyrin repeat domain-containing protein [Oligoflexia bacterium]|nr:ankyrin repeat domain-containing protein [Oligoflexia bacterium]